MHGKIVRWVVVAFLALLLGQFVFGRTGVVTLVRLMWDTQQMEKQLVLEGHRCDSLVRVEKRLQNDPTYIERMIREELGYCHAGETVLKIIPEE